MTWVGASLRALPSTLPLTTNDSPAMACTATLLSTPSRSQTTARRASLIQAGRAFGPAQRIGAGRPRPTPIPLWRQAAVGPSAARSAIADDGGARAAPRPPRP